MARNASYLKRLKKFLKNLGPGLITGASDDDPSGIATYSQAGARFGLQLLWTAIVTYPMIVAIQEMCARIGLVTDSGLMGTIKKYYSKKVVYFILIISFPSITLNIGADIAAMGAVGNMLFPSIPSALFSVVFTGALLYATIRWSYRKMATVLKWLCVALLMYILIPFFTTTNWLQVLQVTIVPDLSWNRDYLMALVGILGTTISPYLFFWQADMEMEEENDRHLVIDKRIIREMNADVSGGLLLSNMVFYFIILTTGSVLFSSGIHNIDTVEDAAQALRPLAGHLAYILFAIGVLGTGCLAIPVLGGSLGYMLAEAFNWEEGMNKKFQEAKGFYLTLIVSMVVGLGILFIGISPIQALIYTAVLYGLVAPLLIGILLHICNNKMIMGRFVNNRWSNTMGWLALALMGAAALALIWFTFF